MKRVIPMVCVLLLLAACGSGAADSAPSALAHISVPDGGAPAPVADASPEPGESNAPLTPPEGDSAPELAEGSAAAPAATPAQFDIAGYGPQAPEEPRLPATAAAGTAHQWAQRAARTLYVAPHGADNQPGSQAKPLRSIARAARLATPGTIILVAPGNYNGGLRTQVSGTAERRIAFISTRKWGARLSPPRHSPNKTAWDNRGDYVDIVGFEIDGSNYQGGVRWTHGIYSGGSHDAIRNNRVHHIARNISCNGAGGAAIGVDSYYGGVQADVIGNLVHDIGPPGCRFVQGIYVSTSARVSNNVVYRVAEGGIHLWHDANNVIITNNTVTASNTGIIVGGGNFYRRKAGNDFTAVYSNIVYGNRMGISEQGKTGKNNTYKNNLVHQNTIYDWRLKNGLRHSGTVSAPPGLVAPLAGAPGLRPAPGSPAIGRASALHAQESDFDGRPRNARTGYDIGAFQH